ncbi:MAG: EamA family transporter [Halobacteriovorax sp.]|nr:EamA family transporter [Halobacteriovorax sp.]
MKGFLFIVAACLLWAVDTLIRYPLLFSGPSAQRIVFTEHLLLTLFLVPIAWKSRAVFWRAQVSHIFWFFIIGAIGSAYATLAFTKAFSLINPSLVILLQKLQPVVAIGLAHVLLGERIRASFLFWALLALFGAFLISSPDILPGLQNVSLISDNALYGYGLTLFAVIAWGSSTVFGKKLSSSGYNETQIMFGRFFAGLVALVPLFYTVGIELDFNLTINSKILAMVVISGLAGMWLYYMGLKRVSARVSALAEMFFPLCAVAINWIFLGKALEPVQIMGAALLILASTMIQLLKL